MFSIQQYDGKIAYLLMVVGSVYNGPGIPGKDHHIQQPSQMEAATKTTTTTSRTRTTITTTGNESNTYNLI